MMQNLRRDLGLVDAVGIGVGAIVGAGIFVVLGVAAGIAGPALLVGLLLAGIGATANALSSAQLAATYPRAGGTYEYGYRVLSPWAGYVAGWMFLVSKVAAAGTVALGFGGYLAPMLPGLSPRLIGAVAVVVFTVLNYTGIRRSSTANLIITALSVSALVIFVVAGAGTVQLENFSPFAPSGGRGILEGAALMFFAYTGYARIATLGEEVREPRRTIPKAILVTIIFTLLLYGLVAVVAVGVAGADQLAAVAAPLEVAARQARGDWLAVIVGLGGITAMAGVLLSQLLGLSRMTFAMARRRDLPAALDSVHRRYGVPHRGVVVVGLAAAVVTITGTLGGIVAAAAFAILIYYGIANLAAIRMPKDSKIVPDTVPWLGLTMCVILALSLPWKTVATGLLILVAGIAVRPVFSSEKTSEGDDP
jgi:APA family basic amino acid/polyamine antiporter